LLCLKIEPAAEWGALEDGGCNGGIREFRKIEIVPVSAVGFDNSSYSAHRSLRQ